MLRQDINIPVCNSGNILQESLNLLQEAFLVILGVILI